MSSAVQADGVAGRRARVLRALGVTPWVRKAAPCVVDGAALRTDLSTSVGCVVILPQACSTRELDLLGRAFNACGASIARAARIQVRDGQLGDDVPPARAYLVFGEAQAHALGRALPLEVMNRAQIVLADEPSLVLSSAGAKRRLWSGLRSLRRTLASTGD